MWHMIAIFLEKIGHVDAVRVMVLAEAQAGGRREPGDKLVAGAALDLIRASHELGLPHVNNDLHLSFVLL